MQHVVVRGVHNLFFFSVIDDRLTLLPQASLSIQTIYVARISIEFVGMGGLQANIF